VIKNRSLIVGLDLDGVHSPSTEGLLVSRMGPQAFLDFLEIHAGILPVKMAQSERIACLMAVMRENEDLIPSFRESWKNAPLATAKELLTWIDTWYLHGWNGVLKSNDLKDMPERIWELGRLEQKARGHIGACIGQRIGAVATALAAGVAIPVGNIELADDLGDWPKAWRAVFGFFSCSPRDWGGNLEKEISAARIDFFVCDSALSATRHLAEFAKLKSEESCLMIVEGEGDLQDEIFAASGKPEAGIRDSAGASPSSQVLPLALALHNDPCDLNAMLAFLSHPVCPMGGIQYGFAEAIAATGGIYNDEWDNARTDALKKWIKWERDVLKFDEFIETWIPRKRENENSFSRARAIEVAKRVIAYLSSLPEGKTGAAVAEAGLFIRTLELLGAGFVSIPWPVIAELLALAGSAGSAHPLNLEEAFSLPALTSAGSLIDPVDSLVWFMPQAARRCDSWPWAKREIAALRTNGCELMDIGTLNSRPGRMMRRACSLVRGKLIVMVPSIRDEISPIELSLSARKIESRVAVRELDHELLNGKNGASGTIREKPLPAVRRWWKCPDSLAPNAEWRTSYSQLSTFIARPAQWALEKKAHIKNGTILSLPEESGRRGTCAHALVERLFNEKKDAALSLSDKEFEAWFDPAFLETLVQYGYAYLKRGASRERINYRHTLYASIRTLCRLLCDAGARNVRLEQEVTGKCCNASFWGSVDLVFDKEDGTAGIIDMKYSFWTEGYIEKMESDTDLQLTLYGEMYRQKKNILPEAAYWIFPVETMIARNGTFFPGAKEVVSPKGHDERLGMIVTSVEWRRKELESGDVEVVCKASDKLVEEGVAAASVPSPGGLPPEKTWDEYDPYLVLYGWEKQS